MIPGRHKARCISWELGRNANTGTIQGAILFEILDGSCKGEVIEHYMYFTDRSSTYSVKDLTKMGWTGTDIMALTKDDIAVPVEIVVESEEFNSQQRLRVRFVNKIGGFQGSKVSLQGSDAEDFARKIKGIALQARTEEDDLPF